MFKKLLILTLLLCTAAMTYFFHWAKEPITTDGDPIPFTVEPGSGVGAAAQQIAEAGAPVNPYMLSMLARATQTASKIKAGTYELKPGTSPRKLLDQLVRGEFAQESLTIIEGWTFKQMRQAVAASKGLKHDTVELSDTELLARITTEYKAAEGLFFPDTYLFAKGSSDLHIYKQAHALLLSRLGAAWENRDPSLPYENPYQALVMASIIEKETGQKSERAMIAGVFVNRLRLGMMLQTDPTVIYGMGDKYAGNIRKRDLETDTPYNTYTRTGLPPTPIALPGVQSLAAALGPAKTDALYFVARKDGTSQFSSNLSDHNRAVNQYQR
ncbi:endolytic transglycosylase MltG [Massilia pseudoviolaceinigra]|uniref:endolytic transglycosylase MltG n=1 Tax=Massilia pseudoviolaceinigra TaxID=3057165 RepID=UPI0035B564FD